ncbi:DUF2789 domain-containing protein [Vibrio sp. JPW-9-11-11]|uniref:DUF2789 family protein n=1 Tax=Vibrio sp. JPW-9-11-11 TaxID=1416532 RepID=UPI001592CA0A|nr:DUF2789 family protein [Vibrio sp. JPW-9-11-11]NVD07352.1 DUF2789 domain-containing protein [Vibrio sp. JPW-9-11-11]
MELHQHTMVELFQQLGLGSTDAEIKQFVLDHRQHRDTELLHEASFWSAAQATFLKQAIEEDADWSELVDQLDVMLRR